MKQLRLFVLIGSILFVGCTPTTVEPEILVSLVVDGQERTFAYDLPVTVNDLLRDANVNVSELDRVNPQPFTQITNGMVITVVRVVEETECEDVEIPYRQRTVLNEGLLSGEERIGQSGRNGAEQVCYRVRVEDGVRQQPVEISRTELTAPQDEIVYVGPTGAVDPVPVPGTLAYISNGNAWVIRGSSTNKRPVTTTSDLDEFVFAVSGDGEKLLYTRSLGSQEVFENELWLINDIHTKASQPVKLVPQNALQAHWIPGLTNTISYSTAESSETAPGWRALNDLWAMRINPETGEALNIEQIIEPSSFGLYSWWGTRYVWAPQGDRLAWVRADAIGLFDLETEESTTVVEFPVFNTRQSWSWRSTVSWGANGDMLATTLHVPVGNYPPETSPAFTASVVSSDGGFVARVVENSGIWSTPQFSTTDNTYLAYLKSRDPFNSINGQYDLFVADRDGSNARRLFPTNERDAGITAREFVWGPEGRRIALVYQGNLWMIDVETEAVHQLTLDGGASVPYWTQ